MFCLLHICLQVSVRCLADSNSWNVNGTPNLRIVKQMFRARRQLAPDNILTELGVLAFSWTFKNQIFSTTNVVFKSTATW